MTNLAGNGLDVIVSDNFTLENNEIKKAGKARQVLTRIFNLMFDIPTFQRPSASLFIGARAR